MLKVQLGSNVWKLEGWVNVDIDGTVNPDIVLEVSLQGR